MKKFLSLVLALVMTMSLVTVAGASFTDADEVNYDAAVDVISELGVVGGYADGSFNPDGTLTRQAAAKIICNIAVGPEAAADLAAVSAPFVDVAADNQFAGYIAYCVNEGIISGYADGTFKPANTLTGYAFLKMLLTTLGYDQNAEGYVGANAQVNILLDAKNVVIDSKGDKTMSLLDGFDGKFNGTKAITREEACLLALNALQCQTVYYKENGSNITIGDVQIITGKGDIEYTGLLADVNFDIEKKDEKKDGEDALGRPGYTWYVDGEAVGTYAKTADIVVENEMDQDDLDELFEDLDWAKNVAEVKEADTKNGRVIELFVNDDDAIYDVVTVEAKYVTAKIVAKDKKATDEDERALSVNGKYVVANDEECAKAYAAGVELDNFEALYAAIDEEEGDELKVLAVFDLDGNVYSVEIPEVVEATITRVVDNTLVAGGEKYLAQVEWETTDEDVELYVGANGVVYDVVGIDPDQSDVIYVNYVFETETDKWGNDSNVMQIVNEDYEVVEVAAADYYDEFVGKFCSYTIDDDEYVLKAATAKDDDFYTATIDIDDEDDRLSKKLYFAEDMVMVYIDGSDAEETEVVVKEGAQTYKGDVSYVLNADGDIAVIYVEKAYDDGVSEDVVYLVDAVADAKVRDLEGDKRDAYEVYVDGEATEWMISNAKVGGFYKYDLDEKTGVYTLVDVNDAVYANVGDKAGEFEVVKDKYVYCGSIDAATLNGEIYDLTEEGLFTLADIADYDGDPLKVAFIYDSEENEITQLYVDFK